mgnify:CR=1 FL=1
MGWGDLSLFSRINRLLLGVNFWLINSNKQYLPANKKVKLGFYLKNLWSPDNPDNLRNICSWRLAQLVITDDQPYLGEKGNSVTPPCPSYLKTAISHFIISSARIISQSHRRVDIAQQC